jgi:hypothetical protein
MITFIDSHHQVQFKYSEGMNEVLAILPEDELIQLHSALDRLLLKLKQYDPESSDKKLF